MYIRRLPFQGQYTVYAACDNRKACTLLDFFCDLAPNLEKDRDHMLELLERIAADGPPRNTDICHQIEGKIWELIKGRLRVFWFYDKGKIIVCTHGIVKQSQKTPSKDKKLAKRTYEQYFESIDNNNLDILDEEDD